MRKTKAKDPAVSTIRFFRPASDHPASSTPANDNASTTEATSSAQ
jgi:hypothetical protein